MNNETIETTAVEATDTQATAPTKRKVKKGWIIALSIVMVLVIAFTVVWVAVAPGLDPTGLRYLVTNSIGSFFRTGTSKEVKAFVQKTGGWVTGVCHPKDTDKDVAMIKDANIGWVRFDLTSLPYTYGENGEKIPTQGYLNFKARATFYAERGIKLMCVTQYPDVYMDAGYDCRTEEGKAVIREMAAFIAQDLKDCVAAFQVTNEMGVDRFRELSATENLTLEQAAEYIGIQLEAMHPVRGELLIGYNLAGWTIYSLMELMKPWHKYCDYIALDLYCGCFENIMTELWFYDLMLRAIWNYTRKPILLNEFGYIGGSNLKTPEEKLAILQSYGYNSEEEARADIRTFFSRLPQSLQNDVSRSEPKDDADLARLLFDTEKVSHIYKEIQSEYKLNKYDHTEADQGRFFTDVIARLSKLKFLCGAIIYCYSDSDSCYVCGQPDCPVETAWGLVDLNGNPKASYYAVKDAFAKVLGK